MDQRDGYIGHDAIGGAGDGARGDTTVHFAINVTSVERVLQRTPLVGIGEYRCPVEHPQFAGGGPQTCSYIVFPRSSVRLVPARWHSEVCTPNMVSLYNVGDTYERHPISDEGDSSDWIALAPELLHEIAEPCVEAHGDRVFARPFAPLSPRTYIAQRALFRAMQEHNALSTLAVEEHAIGLVASVLGSAAVFWNRQRRPMRATGSAIERRQRAITEEAKAMMARQYREALSVSQIARQVHCSAGYLCRTFKRSTGFTLHEYQQQLRLREGLQLLADSWMDLAGIAEHLGFATHSHFTDVFRRRFGLTPTEFNRRRSQELLETLGRSLHLSPR